MKVLDLFSGIGGFSLGLERAGMETAAFCEIEDFPRKVLAKHWPDVPIASDVTKLTYKDGALYDDGQEIYRGTIDVLCGGFPCQDLSTAGRQAGISAARSGLFYEMCRVLSECRPKFAIFENVTNLLNGGGGDWFTEVLCEISSLGYDAEWHCIPASELGAHHHRDRIWIVAYPNETPAEGGWLSGGIHQELTNSYGRSQCGGTGQNVANPSELQRHECNPDAEAGKSQAQESGDGGSENDFSNTNGEAIRKQQELKPWGESQAVTSNDGKDRILADPMQRGQSGQRESQQSKHPEAVKNWEAAKPINGCIGEIWQAEPGVGRVVDGVWEKSYGHRLAALGNAVVPQIPEILGRAILSVVPPGH